MRPFVLAILAILLHGGCAPAPSANTVVVYTALDAEFAEQILHDFQDVTDIPALMVPDTESTKSVGLAQRIMAEAARPRCDVFWNNEILNTLRLEKRGLIEVYRSPAAAEFPAMFRSANGTWCGFAGRARILIVNTKLVPEDQRPKSIYDLADRKWK